LEGTPEELAEHLALRGAPVDDISSPGQGLGDVVVARVIKAEQHPNADRLRVCEVDGGDGIVQVVCGAPNVTGDTYYPFAPVGSVLPGDFKIKKAKIRGEVSFGMLCSSKELGLGTDHDGIMELTGEFTPGEPFVAAYGLDDATLDVEITANRGDLLSHAGVARELASEGAGTVVLPEIPGAPDWAAESNEAGGADDVTRAGGLGSESGLDYIQEAGEVTSQGVSIRIDDPDLCPRYLGAIIRGVKIGPSPDWLQERLRGAGARPINNVVDATNYAMLELGQPMHAFDLTHLGGSSIVVRRAGEGASKFTTLDDEERTLTADMLMICDAEQPVAIGGVMGGQNSEVEDTTTDILLECALFDTKSIRATRKALVMSTDASYRFERGVDPDGMERAIERCIAVILATAGGEVDGPILDCCPQPFETAVLDLRLTRIEHLLGIPFESDYVKELLAPLGFSVEGETGEGQQDAVLHVRIPGFRSYDVTREVDLIEEVARTHGFDRFPDTLGPARPGTVPDHPLFQLEDQLRASLAAAGLFEAHTPAFAPEGEGDVVVANPLATTEPVMRWAILPALLRRVEYNLAHGNRDVRLFEIGTSFRSAGKGEPPHESTHLAAVLTGLREPPHWSRDDEPLEVWDLKALLEDTVALAYRQGGAVEPFVDAPATLQAPESRASESGASDSGTSESGPPLAAGPAGSPPVHLDPTMTFAVTDPSGAIVGHGGRVAADAVDLPVWARDVWAFEITLPADPAPAIVPTHVALPQFPASERDLALLVPETLPAGTVTAHIAQFGGRDLEAVELFDVYTGEGVAEGVRSIAFRLRFRSTKRTLKDKDVDKNMKTILKRLEEDLGVRARG
ncbi:MAG: phenylalanine--tRNA ligase subunit beta, partial [Deltaproteobacteria bacterium]|nr:phenylalanine--tRNA ligase subunit beta [Deltaproteobacteria bacterium]